MAQRTNAGIKFLWPLPPHPDDERALERVHYQRSEWDQLNWYVEFAGKNPEQISQGEFLTLKEELRAIERTLVRKLVGSESLPEPTDEEILQLHSFFKTRLSALADAGWISFDPFQIVVSINYHGWFEHLGGRRWLEHHFVELLKQFGPAVLRCPYDQCGKLFLQPRSNASYCSRQCQNRAAMRKLRERQKHERSFGVRKRKRKPEEITTAARFEAMIRKNRRSHGNKA